LTAVKNPSQADVAILRIEAPHENLHPGFFFGSRQHEGALDFPPDSADLKLIDATSRVVPTVVVISLDRPAILTRIKDKARALVAEFGASDRAVMDVLTGKARPGGHLPLELPSSMQEVEAQLPDAPHDTPNPLYPIFFGRRYP
jgi:beta-glucosidase